MVKHLLTCLCLCVAILVRAQTPEPVAVPLLPSHTHAALANTDTHIVYLPTGPVRQQLLVYLAGTEGRVRNAMLFPQLAARLGYHVICLDYVNDYAATELAPNSTDPATFYDRFREEVCTGRDRVAEFQVDSVNSIQHRLLAALRHLSATQPKAGWNKYLRKDEIQWKRLALAGHSQGAGHAGWLAKQYEVDRVIMIGGPSDRPKINNQVTHPQWQYQTTGTPPYRWFGLLHRYDEFSYDQMARAMQALELPNAAKPALVTQTSMVILPGTHVVVVQFPGTDPKNNHCSLVLDQHLCRQAGEITLQPAWRYLLTER